MTPYWCDTEMVSIHGVEMVLLDPRVVWVDLMDDLEVRVTLRLPQALRDQLANAAEANDRSMNGEIVQRLRDSFSMDATALRAPGGYLEMPDGITAEDVAAAIELANKQALALAFGRLGLVARELPVDQGKEDEA